MDRILDLIGKVESRDPETGIFTVRTTDGRRLKVADLVSDDASRVNVLSYLRKISAGGSRDDVDIIIALGMAKEGFDWPWCEHVLTVGYRSSLTEVVQIIGRATRDCEGKSHAQFTNLIAQPDAADEDVKTSVNNLLKAITLSLLMREVLAPNITFRPRSTMMDRDVAQPGDIIVEDGDAPISPRVKEILESGGVEQILTTLITKPEVIGPALVSQEQAKLVTEVEMPKIIAETFPDLQPEEVALLNDLAKTRLAVQASGGLIPADSLPPGLEVVGVPDGEGDTGASDAGGASPRAVQEFLRIGNRLLHVDQLDIDLIDRINPFQGAFEILSKAVDAPMLKTIQDHVTARNSAMTEEEAVLLWENIKEFKKEHGVPPSLLAEDAYERRLAEALAFIRDQKARKLQEAAAGKDQ
ncbi:helicase-related protein [Desulfovibrio sp.]|uniref:helicase-related protein n=1 Tax=Desulfovibrio sp. TaxID=885 RepID=UPI0025C08E93|nr:helicase-related protein [Desulfovibrio sp.]